MLINGSYSHLRDWSFRDIKEWLTPSFEHLKLKWKSLVIPYRGEAAHTTVDVEHHLCSTIQHIWIKPSSMLVKIFLNCMVGGKFKNCYFLSYIGLLLHKGERGRLRSSFWCQWLSFCKQVICLQFPIEPSGKTLLILFSPSWIFWSIILHDMLMVLVYCMEWFQTLHCKLFNTQAC